jgi:predicted RNA-binding protein with PIN domain
MAFHFLIDGYNLLYALPEMPSGTWQQKREKLLSFLVLAKPQGNNPMTVVFDNREGPGNIEKAAKLTVLFTSGETADDRISAMVRESANPRAIVVVSNDRGIQAMVRGTGARFQTVPEFLKQARKIPPGPRDAPNLNKDDITEEMKKRWL